MRNLMNIQANLGHVLDDSSSTDTTRPSTSSSGWYKHIDKCNKSVQLTVELYLQQLTDVRVKLWK